MKKIVLILSCALLIVAIGILLLLSCEKPVDPFYKIVKMTGGDLYVNFSNFDQHPFGGTYEIENYRDSVHSKILMEGDILYPWFIKSDNEYFYRYSFADGDFLAFTVVNSNLYVNGQLKSVSLDDEGMDPAQLNALEDEVIKNLQSVVLTDSLSPQYLPSLKRIVALNPNVGIIIESLMGNEDVISLFDPSWIVCDNLNFDISEIKNVNQILITDGSNNDFYELSSYPNLQQFIIWMDTVLELGNIPINTSLKSLTVFSSIENLSFVEKFPNLEVLNISNDDQPLNIDAVAQLKNLRIFHLFNESTTTGITALDDLNLLEWITLPSDISDNDLESFVASHPEIKIIGISNNKKVVDLQPLHSLKSLTCLSIYGDTLDIEPLYRFNHLKYLGLPQEILYDSMNYETLRSRLRNTIIVADDIGICLGSGWLLLFIPTLAFVYLLFSFFRRKRSRLTFIKPWALFFAIAILFQCCMVYDKQSVTIEDAINIDHKKVKRIKIDMLGDKKIIFDSIYYKDNQLYGLKLKPKEKTKNVAVVVQNAEGDKIPKKGIEIKINENEIIQIRLHNKSKTLALNISIAVVSGLAIIILGHMVAFAFPAE